MRPLTCILILTLCAGCPEIGRQDRPTTTADMDDAYRTALATPIAVGTVACPTTQINDCTRWPCPRAVEMVSAVGDDVVATVPNLGYLSLTSGDVLERDGPMTGEIISGSLDGPLIVGGSFSLQSWDGEDWKDATQLESAPYGFTHSAGFDDAVWVYTAISVETNSPAVIRVDANGETSERADVHGAQSMKSSPRGIALMDSAYNIWLREDDVWSALPPQPVSRMTWTGDTLWAWLPMPEASQSAVLVRWDDGWVTHSPPPAAENWSLHGSSQDDIWAYDGTALQHFDGHVWTLRLSVVADHARYAGGLIWLWSESLLVCFDGDLATLWPTTGGTLTQPGL